MPTYSGRRIIYTDELEITRENVIAVLESALMLHNQNAVEIEYLWNYYCGEQPVLNRKKDVRPEITNRIVENRANEIVSFKTGYLLGEPLQYVSRGEDADTEAVTALNEYVFAEEKASKDKELADWFHICGTAYRMVLPDEENEMDESPFEIYTLDPRTTFVVYARSLDKRPVMGVTYYKDSHGGVHYSIYTKDRYFEVFDGIGVNINGLSVPMANGKILVDEKPNLLGEVPIIEYPLNAGRLGAFEIVLPLLDAINLTDSNRLDGVEQFIQALMLFHNVDISVDEFNDLKDLGAIKFRDIDGVMKGDIRYLVSELNQTQTQTLIDHMYQTVLTICGMPNRNGGSSTSDTGSAVIMRDGWEGADARAKDTELSFKKSERLALKLMLKICQAYERLDLKVRNVEIRFTRRNYENISQKAQVLDLLLKNGKVHPKLAFEHSGLFVDSDLAYEISRKYEEEQARKAMGQQAKLINGQIDSERKKEDYESSTNTGNGQQDPAAAQERLPSGAGR